MSQQTRADLQEQKEVIKTETIANANTATRIGQMFEDQNDSFLTKEDDKDANGGFVSLTGFKINFKNLLNTFTSFFQNSNTAARTYTFKDRNGTIADDTDLDGKVDKVTGKGLSTEDYTTSEKNK